MADQPHILVGEVWKPVLGHETHYMISNKGRVWSLSRNRLLSAYPDKKGYPRVSLRGHTKKVHHLVLDAFKGPRPEGHEAAHLNGRPGDPSEDNLIWATRQENAAHRKGHGTNAESFRHGGATLSPDQVRSIREMRRNGRTWAFIAASLGIPKTTTINAGRGRHYSSFEPENLCTHS